MISCNVIKSELLSVESLTSPLHIVSCTAHFFVREEVVVVENEDLSHTLPIQNGKEVFIREKENPTFWPGILDEQDWLHY